jgi:hypothetical protein
MTFKLKVFVFELDKIENAFKLLDVFPTLALKCTAVDSTEKSGRNEKRFH